MEFDRLRLCFSFELTLCFRSNRFFFAFMVLLFFLKKTNLHFPRKHNFCISTAAHCSVSALLFLPQNSRCICSTNPLHARGGQKTSQSNHLIVVTDANFSNTFSFFFLGQQATKELPEPAISGGGYGTRTGWRKVHPDASRKGPIESGSSKITVWR